MDYIIYLVLLLPPLSLLLSLMPSCTILLTLAAAAAAVTFLFSLFSIRTTAEGGIEPAAANSAPRDCRDSSPNKQSNPRMM